MTTETYFSYIPPPYIYFDIDEFLADTQAPRDTGSYRMFKATLSEFEAIIGAEDMQENLADKAYSLSKSRALLANIYDLTTAYIMDELIDEAVDHHEPGSDECAQVIEGFLIDIGMMFSAEERARRREFKLRAAL